MDTAQIRAVAQKVNLKVHVQRLPPSHPQAGKIYMVFTDAAGAGAGEFFLTDAEYAQVIRRAASFAIGIPDKMPSIINLDLTQHTVTLPLHKGVGPGGQPVYYILTDTSDLDEAVRLGINWSPKLANALSTAAVQQAKKEASGAIGESGTLLMFTDSVDFTPQRVVNPGPDLFPLAAGSKAGSVGGSRYSPLFTTGDGIVYNGPHVQSSSGMHKKVLSIDTSAMRVTLRLASGFYTHFNVWYVSTDASAEDVAALENATYAPTLGTAPLAGNNDPSVSARLTIIPIVNGPRGADNSQRQGLQSAVAGEGDPLNIIREEPECSDPSDPSSCSAQDYSPLWDVHPVAWTQAAIDAGQRKRLTSHQDVEALFSAGQLVNANPNGPVNDDQEIRGLRALGAVVNCPPMIVQR